MTTHTPAPAQQDFVATELRGIIEVCGDSPTAIVSVERMRLWLSKLRAPVADERAAFERFQRRTGLDELYLERHATHGQYMWTATKEAWETWQARAALASAPVAGEAITDSMIQAGAKAAREYLEQTGGNSPAVIYKAMRDAAPQASEAVRILFPTHLRKMWSGGEVQAWLDEHQGVTAPTPSAKGSLERYRKWQAEQASEAQCSCPSGDGSLRWPCPAKHPLSK